MSDDVQEERALTWPNGQLVDAESIEGYANEARVLAMSILEDGEVRTPDWVIEQLAEVSAHAARMVLVILNAETLKRRVATKLEKARAQARVDSADVSGALQTARIVLATAELKDEYDVAVAAFEYARRIGNLLKDYTGRVQSIGKQVELTYSLGPGRAR